MNKISQIKLNFRRTDPSSNLGLYDIILRSVSTMMNQLGVQPYKSYSISEDGEINCEYKPIRLQIVELLLDVWKEDNDPTLIYFPTVQSLTNMDIILFQLRKKKILGLLALTCFINTLNLLLPSATSIPSKETENAAEQFCLRHDFVNISNQEKIKINVQTSYLEYGVNLVITCILFCLSFYIFFCSQSNMVSIEYEKFRFFLILCTQYFLALLFAIFPEAFSFQLAINGTVLLAFLVKDAFKNKIYMISILVNTILINYLAFEGAYYFQISETITFQTFMGRYDDVTRIYFILLGTIFICILQISKLYLSLITRLVDKINDLQQSLDIKDTYNASMIHELRNPLNAILGAIGLLKYSRSLSKEDNETLNIASMSGEILISLINNALDGAKIEANKLELDPHKSDIVETLTKASSLFQWKAREKQVSLSLKIGKRMPDLVEIDEARITQILVNIIGNAVKFTPEKGNIKVRARFIADEGQKCNSELRPIKTSSSFIEEDEYEERFFDNKELLLEMGEQSQEFADIERLSKQKESNQTRQDYDVDTITEKSQEPTTNLNPVGCQNVIVQVGMRNKNDSFASLCNVESLDEKRIRSKSQLSGREIDFRNSFHEWSQFQFNNGQSQNHPFRNTMKTIISSDPLLERPLDLSNQSHSYVKFDQKKNSNEGPEDQVSQSVQQRKDSLHSSSLARKQISQHAYSENYRGDMSMMSIDSQMLDLEKLRLSRQNLTNSSSSNQVLLRRRTQEKSKFYQRNESEGEEDNSDRETPDRSFHNNRAYSDQQIFINLRNLEEQQDTTELKGQLIIDVIDSGIGISQEGIKRLFQPFQQADKSIQAKYGGTGLGLWITNKLVSLMRGQMEVKSELNKGTCFSIIIPVCGEFNASQNRNFHNNRADANNSSNSNTPIRHHSAKNPISLVNEDISDKIHILLYQDDEIMQKLFKKYLQKHQIEFKFAKNFKDLLKSFKVSSSYGFNFCIQNQRYNSIFLDIDVNVSIDHIEHLGSYCQSLQSQDKNYFCKMYSLYSRDIDKKKAKILARNNIKCIKKPISDDQINKILQRLKFQHAEYKKLRRNNASDSAKGLKIAENTSPSLKRNSNKRVGLTEGNESIPIKGQYDSSLLVSDFTGVGKHIDTITFINQLTESEQKINDDTPGTMKHSFFYQGGQQMNDSFSLNVQDKNKQNNRRRSQFSRTNANSNNNANNFQNLTNSSSNGSSGPQQVSFIQPKVSTSIKQIQKQEAKYAEGSPKFSQIMKMNPNYNKNDSKTGEEVKEDMKTLILKNPKNLRIESPGSQYKSSFQQIQPSDEEEEKKSSSFYQIQTPNFNNLSIQSPSNGHYSSKYSAANNQSDSSHQENRESILSQVTQSANNGQRSSVVTLQRQATCKVDLMKNPQQSRISQTNLNLQIDRNIMLTNLSNQAQVSIDQNEGVALRQGEFGSKKALNQTLPGAAPQAKNQDFLSVRKRETDSYQYQSLNRFSPLSIAQKQSLIQVQEFNLNSAQNRSIAGDSNQNEETKAAVMVVDDNKMNQFIVQKMLEKVPDISKKRVQIIVADNGQEALQKYQENFELGKIKLILMDCEMPILDGYEASKKIREIESNSQQQSSQIQATLIVGLSGNQGEQHSRKCKQAGMNETITKPIVFEQLNQLVKQALELSKQNFQSLASSRRQGSFKITKALNNTSSSSNKDKSMSQSVIGIGGAEKESKLAKSKFYQSSDSNI